MKKFLSFFSCFVFILFAGVALSACCGSKTKSTLVYDEQQENYAMTVSVNENDITIDLSSDQAVVGSGTAKLITMKAYEYFQADNFKGISENILEVDGGGYSVISEYNLGESKTFKIDRYSEDYDNLYNKYYLIQEDKILKGPVYATEITPLSTEKPVLNVRSKKGILGEGISYFKDLDCSSVTLNLEFNSLIYPNEVLDSKGNFVPKEKPTVNYIEQKFNGKSFYFDAIKVKEFEDNVKQYYDEGADVSVVLYPMNEKDSNKFPQLMTYYPWATKNTTIMGINTSTQAGFEYYLAMMEMLASRLTRHNFDKGFVTTFIIGNEIDYAKDYNRISKNQAPFDVYMEEYSRLLRLSNLVVKKYHPDIKVAFSVTNSFAEPGYKFPIDSLVQAYIPKDIVEWMNIKSKMEGDYDWGIAPHNYCSGHARPNVFEYDTKNKKKWGLTADFNSDTVTMSNIEVWDKFVNQDFLKFNGKTRDLYLTETGICAKNEEEELYQAASIAATYYKISQIDSIKWFNYYRMVDHPEEARVGWNHGLMYQDGTKKLSYEVYKYIDTQYSLLKANDYLQYASFYDSKKKLHSFENGKIESYVDLMDVFESGWMGDKEFDWSKALSNIIETHYEWEDKVDLSGVEFKSKSYIYDGAEKSVEVRNVPEGLTVKYSVNGGDEIATTPKRSQIGKDDVIAFFYKDGEKVGSRHATLSVGRMETSKDVYMFGEAIFVNVTRNSFGDESFKNSLSSPWIGLYRKGETPGENLVLSYINIPAGDEENIRSYNILKGLGQDNLPSNIVLPAGEYFIYYSATGGYKEVQRTEFVVLDPYISSGRVDLSNIWLEDLEVEEDGQEHEVVMHGTLPENVKAVFVDDSNKQTAAGNHQVTLELRDKTTDELLETRYAVLKINPAEKEVLATNKTSYYFGESILVTADFPRGEFVRDGSWVAIYRKENGVITDRYMRWYYVDGTTETGIASKPGETYDITVMDMGWRADNSRNDDLFLPGEYRIILKDGANADVAYIDIVIMESPIKLEINKTQFEVGEDVIVTASVPEYLLDEVWWVGLYLRGLTNFKTIYFYYVNLPEDFESASSYTQYNGVAVNIKNDLEGDHEWGDFANLRTGRYTLVLYKTNGYEVIKTLDFDVVDSNSPIKLEIAEEGTQFTKGTKIHIKCTYPDFQSGYQWVALYKGEDVVINPLKDGYEQPEKYLSDYWAYISSIGEGGWEIDTTNLEAGKYTVVMFQNNEYIEATRIVFEITE